MSRRRKRIAAATVLMVAVLGLGLAGYIQSTRASGRDTIAAGNFDGSDFRRYRLNHQVGTDRADAYLWLGENRFASSFEEGSLQPARQELAGSNEPENGDDLDADKSGTANANGAGDGPGSTLGDYTLAGGPLALGSDDANWDLTSTRFARAFAGGYRGGSSGGGGAGGGGSGGDNPPAGAQPNGNPPNDNPNPPTHQPNGTTPSEEGPGSTDPTPPTGGPTEPNPPQGNPNGGNPNGDPENPPAAAVPEPATLGLLGFGFAALGFMRRRRASAS